MNTIPCGLILISFRLILISFGLILISFRFNLISYGLNIILFGLNLISCGLNLISFGLNLISFGLIRISFGENQLVQGIVDIGGVALADGRTSEPAKPSLLSCVSILDYAHCLSRSNIRKHLKRTEARIKD
jgi:hypothetical protein